MATTKQDDQAKNRDHHKREALSALIGEQIIHTLGQPRDLFRVWVRPLWDNNYRVNVFTGADAASAQIANSFFLTVDADGHITTSNPKITKQYEGS